MHVFFFFIECNQFFFVVSLSTTTIFIHSFHLDGSKTLKIINCVNICHQIFTSFQHCISMSINYLKIPLKLFLCLIFTSNLIDSSSCISKNSVNGTRKVIFLDKYFLLIIRVILECANGNRN